MNEQKAQPLAWHFAALYVMSFYHHVKDHTRYPAVLLETDERPTSRPMGAGENDRSPCTRQPQAASPFYCALIMPEATAEEARIK